MKNRSRNYIVSDDTTINPTIPTLIEESLEQIVDRSSYALPQNFRRPPFEINDQKLKRLRSQQFINDLIIASFSGITIVLALYYDMSKIDDYEAITIFILILTSIWLVWIVYRYELDLRRLQLYGKVSYKSRIWQVQQLQIALMIELILNVAFIPPFIHFEVEIDWEKQCKTYDFHDFLVLLIMIRVYQIPRLFKYLTRVLEPQYIRLLRLFEVETTLQFQYKIANTERSGQFFSMLLTLLVLSLGISVGIMENHENSEKYYDRLWQMLTTLTTVGYGEVVPETTIGQVLTAICAFVGPVFTAIIVVIALVTFKLNKKQKLVYSKLKIRIQHDRRVRKLANPAALLIQLRYRVYLNRVDRKRKEEIHIFDRLALLSRYSYQRQKFKFLNEQNQISENISVATWIQEFETSMTEGFNPIFDLIHDSKEMNQNLETVKLHTYCCQENAKRISQNANILQEALDYMTSDQLTIDQEDHTYVRSNTVGEDRPMKRTSEKMLSLQNLNTPFSDSQFQFAVNLKTKMAENTLGISSDYVEPYYVEYLIPCLKPTLPKQNNFASAKCSPEQLQQSTSLKSQIPPRYAPPRGARLTASEWNSRVAQVLRCAHGNRTNKNWSVKEVLQNFDNSDTEIIDDEISLKSVEAMISAGPPPRKQSVAQFQQIYEKENLNEAILTQCNYNAQSILKFVHLFYADIYLSKRDWIQCKSFLNRIKMDTFVSQKLKKRLPSYKTIREDLKTRISPSPANSQRWETFWEIYGINVLADDVFRLEADDLDFNKRLVNVYLKYLQYEVFHEIQFNAYPVDLYTESTNQSLPEITDDPILIFPIEIEWECVFAFNLNNAVKGTGTAQVAWFGTDPKLKEFLDFIERSVGSSLDRDKIEFQTYQFDAQTRHDALHMCACIHFILENMNSQVQLSRSIIYAENDIEEIREEVLSLLKNSRFDTPRLTGTTSASCTEAIRFPDDEDEDEPNSPRLIEPVIVLNDFDYFVSSNRNSMMPEDPDNKKDYVPKKSEARSCACDCIIF